MTKPLLAAGALIVLVRAARRPSASGPVDQAAGFILVPPRSGRFLEVLGLLGFFAYFNFGAFHFGGVRIHLWDSFHHYVGAKYVDEVGYDLLYECVLLADAEEASGADAVAHRRITDLRSNHTVDGAEVLAQPERCRSRFSPERWAAFKKDVAFFRQRFPAADWQNVTLDHGFNASPAWVLFARPLVSGGPLTEARLFVISAIDPVLMAGGLGAAAWGFGAGPAALAAVVWGTYFPARLWWTGGSFLRWDWLAALLAGLALCRRGRSWAGGALLGYAALSRLFPVFALAGAFLACIAGLVRRRPVDPQLRRLLMGACAVALVLVPLSSAVRARPVWREFARNLSKHTSVASPNRMGLGVLLAFDPDTRLRGLGDEDDPRARWETAQAETLRRRRALWMVMVAGALGAVGLAVRDQPAWAACILGLLLIPAGRPLACYYYAFVCALALLVERSLEAGGIVVGLALASGLVARFSSYGMDEQYAAQSLLVVLAFAFVTSCFVKRPEAASRP
jgi:hypothetical protein